MNNLPRLSPMRLPVLSLHRALTCSGVLMVTDGEAGAGAQVISKGAAAAETAP